MSNVDNWCDVTFVRLHTSGEWFVELRQNMRYNLFNRCANVQHIDLMVPLFGRGGISEDLKSILITVRSSTSQFLVCLPCSSPNLVYRSLELTPVSLVFSHYWAKVCRLLEVTLHPISKSLSQYFNDSALIVLRRLLTLVHPFVRPVSVLNYNFWHTRDALGLLSHYTVVHVHWL